MGYNAIDGIYAQPIQKWSDFKLLLRQLEQPAAKEKFDIKLRYYDFLEEQKRINDSIISEVKSAGIKEGIQQGIQKGSLQRTREIVCNMHNKDISIDVISSCTNLKKEEIQNIISGNKQDKKVLIILVC